MYHTIAIKYFTEPIRVENNTIDNRDRKKTIFLESVIFWIGYFNIHKSLTVKWRVRFVREDGVEFSEAKEYSISPGFYNIDHIIDIIGTKYTLAKNSSRQESRVKLYFTYIPGMYHIKLPNELITLLKLPRGWLSDGEYSDDISLQPFQCRTCSLRSNLDYR